MLFYRIKKFYSLDVLKVLITKIISTTQQINKLLK